MEKGMSRREFVKLSVLTASATLLAGGMLVQSAQAGVTVDKGKCTGCGDCVKVCPVEAISMKGDHVTIDNGACVDCEACINECPTAALKLAS